MEKDLTIYKTIKLIDDINHKKDIDQEINFTPEFLRKIL